MEYVFLFLVVIVVILAPIIMSIYALSAASKLKEKVQTLERRVEVLGKPADIAAPPAVAPQAAPMPGAPHAAPVPTSPRPSVRPAAPAVQHGDLERLIGGKWLNWIGIAALLLATAFFLKYAFDNNWIGPIGRVAIGFLAGTALLVYSQWLFKKTYVYFSEGIAGLGAGVLFLSLYAAWNFYQFIPTIAAFAGMALVTTALLTLALGRDSQRIAVLALVGGFVTPLLLNTGTDAEIELFSYLALLNAGLLWVAHARNWRALPLAFVFTLAYFWLWYGDHYDPTKLAVTLAFAGIFFAEFAALPVMRALRSGSLYGEQLVLTLLNAAWFLLALHVMLFEHHRWELTVAVVVLAIGHLAVARLSGRPAQGQPLARIIFAGLALTLVTLAIPIRLNGAWITVGWAIEGAVLVWTGFNSGTQLLRTAGVVLFLLVAIRLVVAPIEGGQFLFNPRFATFAVVIACFGTAAFQAARRRSELGRDERTLFSVVQVAINVLALWGLSAEVLDRPNAIQRQQLFLTLVWTLYAAALLVLGVRANSKLLRWQGLVLLGIGILKVFLFDLSELALGFRILSFMALGVVLLGISFLYQKRLQPNRPDDKS